MCCPFTCSHHLHVSPPFIQSLFNPAIYLSAIQVHLLDAHHPTGLPWLLQRRREGEQWFLEHHEGWLYAVTNRCMQGEGGNGERRRADREGEGERADRKQKDGGRERHGEMGVASDGSGGGGEEGRVGEVGEYRIVREREGGGRGQLGEVGGDSGKGCGGEGGRVGEYHIVRAPVHAAHRADSWQVNSEHMDGSACFSACTGALGIMSGIACMLAFPIALLFPCATHCRQLPPFRLPLDNTSVLS
ncbi:unnamed protein product [Closterium sp. NIES-54]